MPLIERRQLSPELVTFEHWILDARAPVPYSEWLKEMVILHPGFEFLLAAHRNGETE